MNLKRFAMTTMLASSLFAGMNSTSASAAAPDLSVPVEAQTYADEHFKEDVMNLIKTDDPSLYHLKDNDHLRFSKLFPVFQFTLSPNNGNGLEKLDAYYSVIYQDDQPANIISTFQNKEKKFALAGIGGGKDIAEGIDQQSEDKPFMIVKESTSDSWFKLSDNTLYPIDSSAKRKISSSMPFKDFQQKLFAEKSHTVSPVNDTPGKEYAHVGGGGYNNLDGKKQSQDKALDRTMIYSIGSLLIGLAGSSYLIYRSRKKSLKN
ncbi:hypothetical protein A374_03979 [Fictibacillus macauensis ZFHKF-1]|uniref:Gram-positive cocci surface proteins LPxTG domain-containing protein n=1 Tax=Fictibacillus macauensis ZFHKF-1 TaxID=1196324 RepID=I8UII1_9BACL|nr:hypothetical protein [Fictibacillus macauensis]EIT86700.1 hypothetical protein A374_03979 [Fictibacillus macauensis ZFHKF-1]